MSNNKIIGGFEDAIERGQSTVKNSVKQAAVNFTQTAVAQVTGNQSKNDSGTNERANTTKQQMSDDQAKSFLKDLYGPSKPDEKKTPGTKDPNLVQSVLGLSPDDPNKGKTPEEIAKIEALRKTLHADYYRRLTQRPRREETVVEKIEREDNEDRMKLLEKDKKKPAPLPATVKQGTGESVVGVAG